MLTEKRPAMGRAGRMAMLVVALSAGAELTARGQESRPAEPAPQQVARPEPITPSFSSISSQKANLQARLYEEIQERLGIPYLDGGTDERGFDCSGLIWRVFSESGFTLKRQSARILWEELPQAEVSEQGEFGTLVFFSDLTHVGIVRDAFSFYHASSSRGVTRSFFSDYWGERIIGYRRVPLPPRKQRPRL